MKSFLIAIHAILIAVLTIIVGPFDSRGKAVHILSKVFSKWILFIAGVKLKIEGKENLDKHANYIFISNHQSYFDIPVLMQAIPNVVRFIYKDTITKIPIFGWGMYLGGYIPISRENPREAIKSLKYAAERVNKGISVVIFPEGTRSTDGTLGDFKRGAFMLADFAKVQLVPVAISGSIDIMSRTKFKIKSGDVTVKFANPVEYSKDKDLLERIKTKIDSMLQKD
ncbi:MAG: lysophospholipid acyltransferase family protein [Ignavibacteriaceae bacterium]|nr:1-acyl-sn-glycerol-3-phosphate acyltransferase [Ignavibacteria bacterium]MCC6885922.1 1-acyl-sn-glycerol-3-phosphate acyltransferase [Ignavibacteriales bacterium]MEB2330080.1 lysophospholipid acyltransferase family protein [Ignavibacteriaceae bacterium]